MPSDRLPGDRPLLTTDRLELWLPKVGDTPQVHAIVNEPETARHLGPPQDYAEAFSRGLRAAGSWLLYGYGMFMLRKAGEEEIIGLAGIFHTYRGLGEGMDDQPEAGWIVGAGHVGRGYAREAMVAALEWFDRTHGPKRVVAMIEVGNDASFALAERLGFAEFRRAEKDGCELVLLERVPD